MATVRGAKLRRHALDVFGVAQHPLGNFQNLLSGRGDAGQVLAIAGKDLDAEFIFELFDLLGDARLGGEQVFGRRGDIELAPGDLPDIGELTQLHAVLCSMRPA